VRAVLDTNVVVSALLSPFGPPGRVVDLVFARKIDVLYDDRIIAEYEEVLSRPRLRIGAGDAAALVLFVIRYGVLVPASPLGIVLPDPDDLPFVEVASAGLANALVTGNTRHYVPSTGTLPVTVLNPAEFMERWLSDTGLARME
jgi:putative PIN family toxin of toxin-antitoxin system